MIQSRRYRDVRGSAEAMFEIIVEFFGDYLRSSAKA
jgi:hypothetical protein